MYFFLMGLVCRVRGHRWGSWMDRYYLCERCYKLEVREPIQSSENAT